MKNRLKTEPAKFFADLENSDEAPCSAEDVSLNFKKRTPRKRKTGKRKSIDAGNIIRSLYLKTVLVYNILFIIS